jgi:hypothetical protein
MVWGMGFVIHGGGVRSLQIGSIVDQQNNCNAHQNATTIPLLLLPPDKLHCNKLKHDCVPTCSLKVYKLVEIQGGDCCNNWKSHCLGVQVKL